MKEDYEADLYNGFGINKIFGTLGYTDATMPAVMGTLFANSQHRFKFLGDDDLTAYLNEGESLDKFLKSLAEGGKDYADIRSVESAFELVLLNIFDVNDAEGAAEKFYTIRKKRFPVKEDLMS